MTRKFLASSLLCASLAGAGSAQSPAAPPSVTLPGPPPAAMPQAMPLAPGGALTLEAGQPFSSSMVIPSAPAVPGSLPDPGTMAYDGGYQLGGLPIDDGRQYLWLESEILAGWVKKGQLPLNIVTSGANSALPGAPGVSAVVPNEIDYGAFVGVRLRTGMWFDDDRTRGIELSATVFDQASQSFSANSNGNGSPAIGRPFFDPVLNVGSVRNVAIPGVLSGGAAVESYHKNWGAEALLLRNLSDSGTGRVSLLGGFKYHTIMEQVVVGDRSQVIGNLDAVVNGILVGPGDTIATVDGVKARNYYYGGTAGLRWQYGTEVAFLRVDLKGTAAVNQQVIDFNAGTKLTSAALGGDIMSNRGQLVGQPGRVVREEFAFIPEIQVSGGLRLTDMISMTLGYNATYFSRVARPGNMFDTVANPSLLAIQPTGLLPLEPNRPVNRIASTNLLLQSVQVGFLFTY